MERVVLGTASYARLAGALPAIVGQRAPDVIFCPGSHYTAAAWWTRARLGWRCPPIVGKVSNAVEWPDHGRLAAARAMGLPCAEVAVLPSPPALPAGRVVLGVGRLAPQKRWDRAVAALPRLAAADAVLVLMGEGPERVALARQAAALGVADRLVLDGHVADPLPAMARAAAVVLPSDYEGSPGVLAEALSVGTPVGATASSPAVPKIVRDPAFGTVVARGDAGGLVAALDRWLAPGAVRPAPVTPADADSAERYLALVSSA